MVNTRSQAIKYNPTSMNGTDSYSYAESKDSVPDVLTREQMNEFDNGDLLDNRNEIKRRTVNQRFSEMNKQITELTNLVLVLTAKISSSNREVNELNKVSIGHETSSDMVTGASTSSPQTNPLRPPTSQYPQSSAYQIDNIVSEIHHLRDTKTDTVQHPKILQTQVPLFRGNWGKYNEFEHLLLNHVRPHQHNLSEEQKLT